MQGSYIFLKDFTRPRSYQTSLFESGRGGQKHGICCEASESSKQYHSYELQQVARLALWHFADCCMSLPLSWFHAPLNCSHQQAWRHFLIQSLCLSVFLGCGKDVRKRLLIWVTLASARTGWHNGRSCKSAFHRWPGPCSHPLCKRSLMYSAKLATPSITHPSQKALSEKIYLLSQGSALRFGISPMLNLSLILALCGVCTLLLGSDLHPKVKWNTTLFSCFHLLHGARRFFFPWSLSWCPTGWFKIALLPSDILAELDVWGSCCN